LGNLDSSVPCPRIVNDDTVEDTTEPTTTERDRGRKKPSTKKSRGTKTWSLTEKTEIMYCYYYSKVSSRQGNDIMKTKLKERGGVEVQKLAETSSCNLRSLVDRVKTLGTIPEEELKDMKGRAEAEAEAERMQMARENSDTSLKGWSEKTRYNLIWCYFYGQHRGGNAKEKLDIFVQKFNEMHPEMQHQPRKNILQARSNCQRSATFRNILREIEQDARESVTGKPGTTSENSEHHEVLEHRVSFEFNSEVLASAGPGEYQEIPSPHRLNDVHVEVVPGLVSDGETTDDEQEDEPAPPEAHEPINEAIPERGPPDEPETATQLNDAQTEMKETLLDKMEEERYRTMAERDNLPKIPINKTTKELIMEMNTIIDTIDTDQMDSTTLNNLQYCAAKMISEKVSPQKQKNKTQPRPPQQPAWKRNMTKKINTLRWEVSILEEYNRGVRTRRLLKKANGILSNHAIKTDEELRFIIQNNKLKIQAESLRLRNMERKTKRIWQNKMFRENPKKLYREIGQSNIKVEHPPEPTDIMTFWSNIYETEKHHNRDAEWLKTQQQESQDQEIMQWRDIQTKDVTDKLAYTANWKAPGPDRVSNFWLKKLTSTHKQMAANINDIIREPVRTPEWMLEGKTSLLPKNQETKISKNYRPITCLPTTYKLTTGLIADQIQDHTTIADEQKGGKKATYGTKDQLLLNKAILESCRKGYKNLSTAWIDYKKAYDSIPHSWIVESLRLHGVSENIIKFIETTMKLWKTTMTLNHSNGTIEIGPLKILNGIFQGDSLSPLLFIIAMNPLSKELNRMDEGYKLKTSDGNTKVGHLFFVDDLKLYSSTAEGLSKQLNVVKNFSDDINMEFGLDKCAKAEFRKGKLVKTDNIILEDNTTIIKDIDEQGGIYKYLGIEEGETIKHKEMREKIRKEYIRRVKMILKTELTTANKIKAINQLAVPAVTYSFGVITWYQKDLDSLDTKTRKLLHSNKMIYKNQCIPRVYIPRSEGGMGLIELDYAYRSTIVGIDTYISHKEDKYSQAIKYHEDSKPRFVSTTKLAKTFRRQVGMETEMANINTDQPATTIARKEKKKYKAKFIEEQHQKWENHNYSGRYKKDLLNQPFVDLKETHGWLTRGDLQPEDERIIMAAQDKGLRTRWFTASIEKTQDDPKCRFCGTELETTTHLVSGCEVLLAEGLYTKRHNSVARLIHHKLCKEYEIGACEHHWEHEPEVIMENNLVKITWDASIPTSIHIAHNRPDIILLDKKEGKCYIIEIATPNDYNVLRTERHKIMKYTQLATEIKKMWKCKDPDIIPVVLGATGLIKKSLQCHLDRIPVKITIAELQRETIKGSCIVFKRALAANLRNG